MYEMTSIGRWQDKTGNIIAKLLVVSLSGLGITIFVGWKDVGPFKVFDLVSLAVLLAWRYVVKYHSHNPIPRQVLITSLLFIASLTLSAFLSIDRHFAFVLLKQYRLIFLGGLLFTAPISSRYRMYVITVFFLAAAAAGLIGILQNFGLVQMISARPHGFSKNPNLYAGALSVACSSAVVMLFLPKTHLFASRKGFAFIIGVASLTLCGIILSQSRSIWVALFAACVITLFLYDRRKTLMFLLLSLAIFAVLISSSSILRQRMISIVTSVYTEDVSGSTGNRIELWKGALVMFKENPSLGIGLGDFQPTMDRLIAENKLKQVNDTHHAHNIYLQVLATRGVIGIAILLFFLLSLLKWGKEIIHDHDAIGGYIIILITVLAMVGGLTDDHLDFSRFLTASCFTVGLLGPVSATRKSEKVISEKEGKSSD